MTHTILWRAARATALGLLFGMTACGGSSTSPSPPPTGPVVSAVSPASGPSVGGTQITISGQRFDATATVTVGGVAAKNVAIVSPSTLTATTPPRTIGAADVAVTVGGQRGVLPNAFTYLSSGPVTNTPPVIGRLTAVGSLPNEPAGFAEGNEELTVTAVVTDAETAASDLVFEWAADAGVLTGTGASVKWKAPALFGGPVTARLTVTVIERYTGADPTGNPVPSEHRVSAVTSVSVHDSVKENGELATAFLTAFSNSTVSPETAVRFFYTGCAGRQDELADIANNRSRYRINSYTLGSPTVSVAFGATCPFRSRLGDACIALSCEWNSTIIATGATEISRGTCRLSSVYRDSKWQLCDSDFEALGGGVSPFMR